MSSKHGQGLRCGVLAAVLLGASGCGGPAPEEPLQRPGHQAAALESEAASTRCEPAHRVIAISPPETEPGPSFGPFTPTLADLNGTLYFFAAPDGPATAGLWKSNGTTAGTTFVTPGGERPLVKSGDQLFFLKNGALWTVDEDGARAIKDVGGTEPSTELTAALDIDGTLFFVIRHSTSQELWMSDGTRAGTRRLKRFEPLNNTGFVGELTNVNGTVFFAAQDPQHGTELWKTGWTPESTTLFKDLNPGPADSVPLRLLAVGGNLYFTADDGVHGRELWTVQDEDPDRTFLLKDVVPGAGSSFAAPLHAFQGRLFFTASPNGPTTLELWKTDGTRRGTVRVSEVPNTDAAFAAEFSVQDSEILNGRLYFTLMLFARGGPGVSNVQLWRTDGTAPGPVLWRDQLMNGIDLPVEQLLKVDGTLLFAASDGFRPPPASQRGVEPWRTDGTRSGTRLLQDITPGEGSSFPTAFTRSGRFVFFGVNGSSEALDLWALPANSVSCPHTLP